MFDARVRAEVVGGQAAIFYDAFGDVVQQPGIAAQEGPRVFGVEVRIAQGRVDANRRAGSNREKQEKGSEEPSSRSFEPGSREFR